MNQNQTNWNLYALFNPAYMPPVNSSYKSSAIYLESTVDYEMETFLPNKVESTKSLITLINKELAEREKIHLENTNKIYCNILDVRNQILEVTEPGGGYNLFSKRRSILETQLQNLYREVRDERVQAFRDRTFITKDLLTAFREYAAVKSEDQLMKYL